MESDASLEAHHRKELFAQIDRASSLLAVGPLDCRALGHRLDALRDRLLKRCLQIAVLGQFKRGKSTFINALLGAPVLPVGVIPITAVPVFISWADQPSVRVRFKTNRPAESLQSSDPRALQEFLSRFVAEEKNPKNCLDVERVTLQFPAKVLANGIVLIDTPGVGSTHQHNTEAALRILPECDAAIFVISADPPITEVELDYLDKIKSKAARIFFILNKLDYLEAEEQSVALDFLRKVLSKRSLLKGTGAVYGISAREGLAAKQSANRDDLSRSGMAEIEDLLVRGIAGEKNRLLVQAIAGAAQNTLQEALENAQLRAKALKLPISELTSKANAFEAALGPLKEQQRTMHDLLDGDRRRLIEMLEGRIQVLRNQALLRLAQVTNEALTGNVTSLWDSAARETISDTLEEIFESAREALLGEFSKEAASIIAVHQSRLNAVVDRVRLAAAEIFDVPVSSKLAQSAFELGQEPYWISEAINATLLPEPQRLMEVLLPLRWRRSRVFSRIMRQTNDLVVRNAENLRWALLRGIAETMHRTTDELDGQLRRALVATKGVIDETLVWRENRALEAANQIAALDHFSGELRSVQESLLSAAS